MRLARAILLLALATLLLAGCNLRPLDSRPTATAIYVVVLRNADAAAAPDRNQYARALDERARPNPASRATQRHAHPANRAGFANSNPALL